MVYSIGEYVEGEKNNLEQIINSKIDNKDMYALDRCIEEMYKDEDYALYKYGYVEDLKDIDAASLHKHYMEIIKNSKIDIFISGGINEEEVMHVVDNNITNLDDREAVYIKNSIAPLKEATLTPEIKKDKKNIVQGKLVIGLDIVGINKDVRYIASMYNTILGDSANSKLFQNVREKAHLAYSARSSYIRQKNNIYIRCGIDIENYETAIKVIEEQIDDMKNGNFSEEDIDIAKKYMEAAIKLIKNEPDAEIIYYLGQELSDTDVDLDTHIENIKKVTFEAIKDLANKISINTIYFLRN